MQPRDDLKLVLHFAETVTPMWRRFLGAPLAFGFGLLNDLVRSIPEPLPAFYLVPLVLLTRRLMEA
jgi:hypothetical protein